MQVEHTLTIHGRCPENGDADVYRCTVYADRLIRCEDIVSAAAKLADEPLHQETLTARLACRLRCRVRTVGTHCGGAVETTCICGPGES